MSIKFFCTFCGQKLGATEAMAGGKIRCPQCSEVLAIPGARRPRASKRSDRRGSHASDRPTHERAGSGERTTPASRRPPHVASHARANDEEDVFDVELEPIDDNDPALAPLMPTYSVSEAPLASLPASVYTPAPEPSPYAAPGDYGEAPRSRRRKRGSKKHDLAARSSRLGASIIDGIFYAVFIVAGAFLGPHFGIVGAIQGADGRYQAGPAAYCALGIAMLFQCALIATTGQSLGKRATGIRIVTYSDGEHANPLRTVVLRTLLPYVVPKLLGPVGSLLGLLNILFVFGPQRRCLHDYLAGTCVVDD